MSDTMPERALIAAIQRGDNAAVSILAERYWARIHRVATRVLRNPEDAEEVAQDVLLKVSRGMRAFRSEAALYSWMYRITFNTAISRLRMERSRRRIFRDGDWVLIPSLLPTLKPDSALVGRQIRKRVAQTLLKLPPEYRHSVLLRDVRGLSTRDAALALGVNLQTLKSRLHRGRLVLRHHLAEFADGPTRRRRGGCDHTEGTSEDGRFRVSLTYKVPTGHRQDDRAHGHVSRSLSEPRPK